jgi:hypothetical protein
VSTPDDPWISAAATGDGLGWSGAYAKTGG